MKITKIAVLGAAVLGLCATASAATDYTQLSINLSGTGYQQVTVPGHYQKTTTFQAGRYMIANTWVPAKTTPVLTTLAINNAMILAKIGTHLGVSLAGDSLVVDNANGHICVLNSAGALVYDLNAGVSTPTPDTNGVTYKVQATDIISPRDDSDFAITKGTSGSANLNFSVSGSLAFDGFSIVFSDDYFNFAGNNTDAVLNINGGVGTFTTSLTDTQTYKESLTLQVFGSYSDYIKNIQVGLTGTLTASGGSTLQPVPSIWDVVNPVPGS